MSDAAENNRPLGVLEILRHPTAGTYLLVGITALFIYYLQMSERGGDLGALLAIVVAIPGLTARWVISPVAFLTLTTYLIHDPNFVGMLARTDGYDRPWVHYYGRTTEFHLADLLLASSILLYLMVQYRLLSLMHKSMPEDPSPRRKGQPEPSTPRRPLALVAFREVGAMLQFTPVCVLAGVLSWLIVSRYEGDERLGQSWGIEQPFARLMLFLWVFITTTIVTGIVFRHLALRRMTRAEARLLLQDMFWQETRREQERIYRWREWLQKRQANADSK